jgi:hypothetical protein
VTIGIDARAVRTSLAHAGYIVAKVVPEANCRDILTAIDAELWIRVGDPATWDLISREIDQVPLWGHQSQWDVQRKCRFLSAYYVIGSVAHESERECSEGRRHQPQAPGRRHPPHGLGTSAASRCGVGRSATRR